MLPVPDSQLYFTPMSGDMVDFVIFWHDYSISLTHQVMLGESGLVIKFSSKKSEVRLTIYILLRQIVPGFRFIWKFASNFHVILLYFVFLIGCVCLDGRVWRGFFYLFISFWITILLIWGFLKIRGVKWEIIVKSSNHLLFVFINIYCSLNWGMETMPPHPLLPTLCPNISLRFLGSCLLFA